MNDEPAGARSHYRDARYYDHTYRRYRADVQFYLRLARELGGPVLELGVGTGRIAFAIAEAGIELVGIDREEAMLARAHERLAEKPRRVRDHLTLMQGDVRTFAIDRRFPLVIGPFNVFQHLYALDDFEAALARCREHLAPDGLLAFDVLVPDVVSFGRDPGRFYKCRPMIHPRDGRRYAYAESFSYDHARQVQVITMRFTDLEDPSRVFFSQLVQRQFFPLELEALLRANGFTVLRHDGGFDGEPIDDTAESQVIVARRR